MNLLTDLNFSPEEFVANPKEQTRVLNFFENLKNSLDGWKTCINFIATNHTENDQLKFFCLQVVEQYIKTRYAARCSDDVTLVRQFLQHWLEQVNSKTKLADSYFLKNKMAQLFSLVFLVDFPDRWKTFVQDVFLNTLNVENEFIVEFYLLVVLQIDAEVSDREIPKSKEIADRNTKVRDNMRICCITDMIESWYKILIKYRDSNGKLAASCLHCLGGYIVWIDIGLVANERFMPLIVECLNKKDGDNVSTAAADCLCSILNKGMDPQLKLQLVQAVDKLLTDSGVYNVNDSVDSDVLSRISEIVSCVGSILVELYHKTSKSAELMSLTAEVLSLIESKLQLTLICLAHEDISIATCAAQFCHEYVVLLKQLGPVDWKRREFLSVLLTVLLKRYRYPADYEHEREGEDEIDFQEFRKELKTIFTNVALLDLVLTVECSEKLVNTTFNSWSQVDYSDVELAISLLHILGEVLQFNQGSALISSDEIGLRLKRLVHLMISSGVSKQKHPAVCLQYFETVCRYDKIIAMESSLLPDVIASFLDDRGLHHSVSRVRSRATYLFSKFIRLQRTCVQNQVDQILFYLQDLLELSPTSSVRLITSDDQLFLFETVGMLIVSGSHSNEQKRSYMKQLLGSLVSRFNQAMIVLNRATDDQERKILVDFLNYLMAYASRTSKGFSQQVTMKSCSCEDIYIQLMKVFLDALQPSPVSAPLLSGLRQYLHRMIISLGDEMLPYLPIIIQKFVAIINESRLLQDFLTLVQQAVVKYKTNFVTTCGNDMVLLHRMVWNALSTPHDPNDEIASRDSIYLRRSYHQLLLLVVKNELFLLLTCLDEGDLQLLLQLLVQGCLTVKEPVVQKSCFNTVQKCVEFSKNKNWSTALSPLVEFFRLNVLPACFVAPLKSGFDFADAQSVMVISEIGALLKQFYEDSGDTLTQHIANVVWPSVGLPIDYINEFLFGLRSMDLKSFQKYLRNFFENMSKTVKFD